MHPKRTDGQSLHVLTMPDGRVFVDIQPENRRLYGGHGQVVTDSRGGPEHSRHFCRFEDYGLADGLVRCRKCGLVKEGQSEPALPTGVS